MKLSEIQSKIHAPKAQTNSFGKYKYRSCEDILEAIKPVLKEYNCSLLLTDEIVLIGERYYVKATAILSDGIETIEVSALAREEDNKKGMDSSQLTGATSSYARKYALNGMFAIDDTKDSDFNNNGETKKELPEMSGEAFAMAVDAAKTDKTIFARVTAKYKLTDKQKTILSQSQTV